jgi:hypothetical protein
LPLDEDVVVHYVLAAAQIDRAAVAMQKALAEGQCFLPCKTLQIRREVSNNAKNT